MKITKLTALTAILMVPVVLGGCSREPSNDDAESVQTVPTTEDEHAAHHSHGAGPHDGTLMDWGGGAYHVEFTVDHDRQEAVVYILGDDEQTPAPVAASDGKLLLSIREPAFQVELDADPQPDDPEGTSSRFVGQHENLGIVQEFAGTISAEIDGTPYAADFQEEAHSH